MLRLGNSCTLALVLIILALPTPAYPATYQAAFLAGTQGGPGGTFQMTVADLSPDARWKARVGVTYSTRDPGNPDEAREIFINDATNGTPQKKGRLWTFALDLLVPVWQGEHGAFIDAYGGPRRGSFTGNFAFVGGNEDFDIREKAWAFGGGLEDHIPLSRRTELLLQGGVDYYLASNLQGHDTLYSPDNQNVNPRKDFKYHDADEAVNQPRVEARVMVGLAVRLGR